MTDVDQTEHGTASADGDAAADPRERPDEAVDALGDLDDSNGDASPEAAVADSLRTALESMRDESTRIAELDTGDEQVSAAEAFAEDAGTLDAQLGSLARSDDEPRG